jgi:hypothetical protein
MSETDINFRANKIPEIEKLELLPWNMVEFAKPEAMTYLRNYIRMACGEFASETGINNTISSIQSGHTGLWKLHGIDATGGVWVVGFLTTNVLKDTFWDHTILKIGVANIIEGLPDELWEKAFTALEKYAKDMKCNAIQTDIINPAMIDRVVTLGFSEVCRTFIKEV